MLNQLDALKTMSTVVADTGDFALIEHYTPQDATTNPSLILKASSSYPQLLQEAVRYATAQAQSQQEQLPLALRKVAVSFGAELLKKVPGRVSTEVDARTSFDTQATLSEAYQLLELYQRQGIEPSRLLLKIAATWEGIAAARELEREGIHCNLTLVFSLAQALACADAGVFLISPFVGRIYDWYKERSGRSYLPEEDPGVHSVHRIYNYLRKFDYPTIVMGASFRHVGQIQALAGCDYLTISPDLLKQLQSELSPLERKLSLEQAKQDPISRIHLNESEFRWQLNEDAMASEKLAEGIRIFARDAEKLQLKLLEQQADA